MSTCPFEITPLAQSEPVRTPQLANLNYTNQDFFSLKSRLRDLIKEKFPDDFNDFVESSLGIMLMELWAFLADTITFKTDQMVNELFIDTVSEVENAFRLSRLVGFEPTPPIAARAWFSATINSVLATDLTIPGGLAINIVSENRPTNFELFPADADNNPIFDEDIIVPAGALVNTTIVGVEGTTYRDVFSGNGAINQTFTLSNGPVIYDNVRVDVDGIRWRRVDYFTDDQPRREYRVEFDSDYQAFVVFGNNTAGLIPSNGSQVEIIYRVGGGTIGNIITGFIDIQRNVEVSGFDFSVPVTFRNYTKGEYGYNGDGLEDIRRKLPAYLRTQNRAVTGTDYKTLADQFVTPFHGQIGKSTAVLRNYGCAANIIDLYVLARDGQTGLAVAGDDLKADLSAALDEQKMVTDYVCIRNGTVVLADVVIDLTVDKFYKKMKEELTVHVQNRTADFFSLHNWEYGQTLRDIDLIKALSGIREIRRFDITFTTNDPDNSGAIVTAKFNEIIRPDTISVSFVFE
jgi:hypothetical protein